MQGDDIPLKCPYCAADFMAPADVVGFTITCKQCHAQFTAPSSAQEAKALAKERAKEVARREMEESRKAEEQRREEALARSHQEQVAKKAAEDEQMARPASRGDLDRLFGQPPSQWVGWTVMQAVGFLFLVLFGGLVISVLHDDSEAVRNTPARTGGAPGETDARVRVTKDTYTHVLLAANFVVMVTILVELRRRR